LRIKCFFESNFIPVDYNMMFVSFIKECLKKSDEDYFNKLFYYQNKQNKKSKNYSFAIGFNNFKLDGNVFNIGGDVIFNLTSPDLEFFVNFYNGLLKTKFFNYKEYTLKRKRVVFIKEKVIDNDEVIFKTLSPICIKDKNNNYLDIDDEKFNQELSYIADLIVKNFRGYGIKKEINFEPIDMKKRIVKLNKDFLNQNKDSYYKVNAYSGTFKLKGDVEDLNLIYQLGLSFRRNQGFGMLEVV